MTLSYSGISLEFPGSRTHLYSRPRSDRGLMDGKEEILLAASSSAHKPCAGFVIHDINRVGLLALPTHVVIAVVIPVVIIAALVIAIVSILAVIVPAMPLVTIVPISVAISKGDRAEVDLDDARTAITPLIDAGRLSPAVTAVAIVIPVVVNSALLIAIGAIIVMAMPTIPMMILVPITVAIADGDIAEIDLNARSPIVVVALRGCRTDCRERRTHESQRDESAFQEITHK